MNFGGSRGSGGSHVSSTLHGRLRLSRVLVVLGHLLLLRGVVRLLTRHLLLLLLLLTAHWCTHHGR